MWNYYDGYHFFGMHWIWWLVWLVFLFWIFALPYRIPGQRFRNESPLDILKKRLAKGEITEQEYENLKKKLDSKPDGK